MGEDSQGYASKRFLGLLALYRRPDGSAWSGQNLEHATGWVVTRSSVSNLKSGRIETRASPSSRR